MAGNIKGINIELGAETTGLDKALTDVNKKSRDLQNELKQVERLLKLDPSNTELVAQKQKLLQDAISNSKEKLDRLRVAQEQVNEQFRKGEINEEQYRAFQREVAKSEQQLSKLESQLVKSKKSLGEFGESMQSSGDKMKNAGQTMTTHVTAPILAAGAGLVSLGSELDSAFDKIRIGTGASGEALERLKLDFRSVAAEVPSSFDEVATALSEYNKRLDISGTALRDLSTQTLNLVRVTEGDLAKTIEDTSQSFMAFNVPVEKYGESLDFIFRVSQFTGIAFDSLQGNLVKFGPVLQTLGLGFEQSAALMGHLEKAGVNTDQALAGLSKAVANLAKEGVTDANKALEILFDRIKNAPNDMKAAEIAMETFGAKAGPAMAKNIREGKLEYQELLDTLQGSKETINGVANDTDDWAEKLGKLWNNIKLALEPISGQFFEAINKLIPSIQAAAGYITQFAAAFVSLPEGVQTAILVAVALIAALGPLLMVVGMLVSGIGGILTILPALGGALGVLLGPVGIVVAAIAALAAAFVYAYKNSEEFRDIVNAAFGAVKEFITNSLTAVAAFIKTQLDKISKFWDENGEQILEATVNVFKAIKAVIEYVMPAIQKVIGVGWEIIKALFSGALDIIMGVVKVFSGLFTGDFSKMWEGVVQIFKGALGTISKVMGSITGAILDALSGLASKAFNYGADMLSSLWSGMRSVFANLKAWFDSHIVPLINKLNPFARHSPSLVDNVKAGLKVIEQAYKGLDIPQYDMSGYAPAVPAYAAAGTSNISNTRNDANYVINVTIPAKDIAEMKSVADFFDRLPQVARQGA